MYFFTFILDLTQNEGNFRAILKYKAKGIEFLRLHFDI